MIDRYLRKEIGKGGRTKGRGSEDRRGGVGSMSKILTCKLEYSILIKIYYNFMVVIVVFLAALLFYFHST